MREKEITTEKQALITIAYELKQLNDYMSKISQDLHIIKEIERERDRKGGRDNV